jgi:hypothetical protein
MTGDLLFEEKQHLRDCGLSREATCDPLPERISITISISGGFYETYHPQRDPR